MRNEKTLKKLPYRLVMWDWKDQPDWLFIQKQILKGFKYLSFPETYNDSYALILTKVKIREVESNIIYSQFEKELIEKEKK